MRLLILLQDSNAYDSGYKVGYMVGKALPFIILVVIAFFLYKYFKKKSNK